MNPKIKYTIFPVLALLLHLYLIGSIISIFFIVTQSEWSMDSTNPNSISTKMDTWKEQYMFQFHSVKIAFNPTNDFEKSVSQWTWVAAPFFMVLVFFGSPKSWGNGKFKEASKYGSHGSARWARRKEIFRIGEITGNPVNELNRAGIILGSENKKFGKGEYITVPPDSEINQNVIVYGNPGIGKGFTYVKPQIFHTMTPFEPEGKHRTEAAIRRGTPEHYSLVVTDPKGEHYTDCAQSLMDDGYEVYVFNLIKLAASHRWNPMDYVNEDLDAEKLANLIISHSGDGHGGGDPFWAKAEKALMSAIILFVKHELPPQQINMPNVLHIGLTYGRDEDTLNMLFDSLPYNHPAIMQYSIFRVAPADTRAGILIGFGTQISLFGYKEISNLTSQSDFRLDDIARKKTALFLIIPDSDSTYSAITALFMNQAMQQWWKVADENDGVCPVGVRVLGDEWTNIGKVPMLAERISVMRSKGISLQIIVQAKSQLYKLYKDDTDAIIQACDTVVFLGTNDKKTAEELSNDLGDMTIKVSSTSQQQNVLFTANPNESQQYQARKLMTPDELKRATRKLNIIVQNGGYPFKTVKTPFIHHPNAKGYKKLKPKEVVPPPHRGFELFSQDNYNQIVGLNIKPTDVVPEEARENFQNGINEIAAGNILETLDEQPVNSEDSSSVVYADPIQFTTDHAIATAVEVSQTSDEDIQNENEVEEVRFDGTYALSNDEVEGILHDLEANKDLSKNGEIESNDKERVEPVRVKTNILEDL